MNTIKKYLNRTLFVLLSTTVMVFFSEKTFWYIQGYPILELVLFYAVPVAVCLWVINLFQVERLSGMVLIGALFGFLVEGVLTPVVYEAGLLDPVMPAYFIGWHGLLSLVFGWYFLRKWLVKNENRKLLLASSIFGIFWGIWSLPFRLPESVAEFEGYNQAGESWLPGAWPVGDYLFYTLTFTLMLMLAHWLLGRGIWQRQFKLKWPELGVLLALLVLIFSSQVFPVEPLGIVKLIPMLALAVLPLIINHLSREEQGALVSLDGGFKLSRTFPFLLIPFFATLIYGLAALIPPPEQLLRWVYSGIFTIQTLVGAGFFIWAWVDAVKSTSSKIVTNDIY